MYNMSHYNSGIIRWCRLSASSPDDGILLIYHIIFICIRWWLKNTSNRTPPIPDVRYIGTAVLYNIILVGKVPKVID